METVYTGKKATMQEYFDNTPALFALFIHPLWYLWYLSTQFKGWVSANYMLVAFTIGMQLTGFLTAPSVTTAINATGMILGVTCITAINAHKSVNGWLGLVSAGFIIASGLMSKDWGVIFQQVAYIMALDIPVLLSKAWMGSKPISNSMDKKGVIMAIVSFIGAFIAMYIVITLLGTPRIIPNSFLFAVSFTSSILCLKHYRIQYIGWFITSMASLWTWSASFMAGDANWLMLVGALIYLSNDIIAFTLSEWYAPYPFNINHKRYLAEHKTELSK